MVRLRGYLAFTADSVVVYPGAGCSAFSSRCCLIVAFFPYKGNDLSNGSGQNFLGALCRADDALDGKGVMGLIASRCRVAFMDCRGGRGGGVMAGKATLTKKRGSARLDAASWSRARRWAVSLDRFGGDSRAGKECCAACRGGSARAA